ncbi:hypothetical protein OSB04_008214 [Centaurea solstitialis]|uniref:Vacuolar protein sorting-associated protein Ist1 n=1 Tax=Centaurea solstitialis TaxID=347529 RepID=A0AA38TLD3_9ASTR|nr:hypothetical protein OSB04_008214 [Centaurea solstitialis]
MFEFIFGWRKASKCKKLIKKVQYHLNFLKNKKNSIVKQLRNDVAELIGHGQYQAAFNRVDQIYRDECMVAVYELLDIYCEIISLQMSYIRRNKDCPDDIKEAISSLIFASATARCGNLHEFREIRKLFSERYGKNFETTALELLPGNLVNEQIIENLSIKNVPSEVKYKLVEEIRTSVDQSGPLASEFASEKHQQATNNNAPFTGTGTEQIAANRFHIDHPGVVDSDPSIPNPESSSENPTVNGQEEIAYFDDIAEFRSPLHSTKTDQIKEVRRRSRKSRDMGICREENPKTYESNNFNIEHSERLVNEKKLVRRRSRKLGELGICRDYDYRRAVSTPCKRSTKHVDENGVKRSNSVPVEPSPPHVHPKLPDYDEIAALFKALKKEHLQKHK